MVAAIRPLRFLHRQKSLLSNFVRRHRKALLIVGIIVASFFTMNIASAVAFNQKAEIDGVRLEPNRAVYAVLEAVNIRLFLVNKLDSTITVCPGGFEVVVSGPAGRVFAHTVLPLLAFPDCERTLPPRSEVYAGREESWIPLFPGPYTIQATVFTFPELEVSFTGSITVLVVAWHS